MDYRTWLRVGGVAGVLFGICFVIGAAGGGPPPRFGASALEISRYYATYRSGLQGTYLIGNGLPGVFGPLFFGALTVFIWRRAPDDGARCGAAIGAIAVAVLGASGTALNFLWAIPTYDAGILGGDGPALRAIQDGIVVCGALLTLVEGAVPLAYGLALLGLGGAWRTSGYAGILAAVLNFGVAIAAFVTDFRIGAAMLLGISTLVLWTIGTGILLATRGVQAAAATVDRGVVAPAATLSATL